MGHKFSFTEIIGGDEPNIQICYESQIEGQSIANYNGTTFQLTDSIARNILFILDSEQFLDKNDIEDGLFFKGKFSDCHSFALIFAAGVSYNYRGKLNGEMLSKVGYEEIGAHCFGNQLPQGLKQGDIFITDNKVSTCGAHSSVYLGKIGIKDMFIECVSMIGYVNELGEYYTNHIYGLDIFFEKYGKKYVGKGHRVGGRIKVGEIKDTFLYSKYCGAKNVIIYRKK